VAGTVAAGGGIPLGEVLVAENALAVAEPVSALAAYRLDEVLVAENALVAVAEPVAARGERLRSRRCWVLCAGRGSWSTLSGWLNGGRRCFGS
jgi:hypothetical protein